MPDISVIIPTYKRWGLLLEALREYKNQIISPELFEIIVVSDKESIPTWFIAAVNNLGHKYKLTLSVSAHKLGPAGIRNMGAKKAEGKVFLFAGDDCIPTPGFVWRHWYNYAIDGWKYKAVQGYTDWYPYIPPTDFMLFLTEVSGVQANWPALRDDKGNWKKDALGWFMTTNCSISREPFLSENGFNEEFPYAAWEDVEFAYRLAEAGLSTIFDPEAKNYHYHAITLESYISRQIKEGESRLTVCKLHPELSAGMIDPKGLRDCTDDYFAQTLESAKDLNTVTTPEVQNIRYQKWMNALRAASLMGIKKGISKRGQAWQALPHVHTQELLRFVCGTAGALENNDPMYAKMESEWALLEHSDNWALHAVRGEVELALGNTEEAKISFMQSAELAPTEEWPKTRLMELRWSL